MTDGTGPTVTADREPVEKVFVEDWTSCVDATVVDTDSTALGDSTWTGANAWPESGSGIAFAWREPIEPNWPDSSVVIGHFTLSDDSQGVLSIAPHPQSRRVAFVDKWFFTHELPPVALGRVDVVGLGLGYNPCGVPRVGPVVVPQATIEDVPGGSPRTNYVECGALPVTLGDALWTTDFDSLSAGARERPFVLSTVTDGLGTEEPIAFTLSDSSGAFEVALARTRALGPERYHEPR